MAFKMKAGSGGPMKKNFPGAFKAGDETTKATQSSKTAEYKAYLEKKRKFQEEHGHGHDASYSDFTGKKYDTKEIDIMDISTRETGTLPK